MRVAIGLQTCGREDHTRLTLDTLTHYNPTLRDRFILLHADDGSETEENQRLASEAGFRTCFAPHERMGQIAGLRRLLAEADRLGAEWFLYLENDWESVLPIPDLTGILTVGELSFDCLRLYGATKARAGRRAPTGRTNMVTGQAIEWRPLAGGFEFSPSCHWAGPPSVTWLPVLKRFSDRAASAKEVSKSLTMPTLRVVENIFYHSAERTTVGFRP